MIIDREKPLKLFDVAAAWAELTPEEQAQIGKAVLSEHMAALGYNNAMTECVGAPESFRQKFWHMQAWHTAWAAADATVVSSVVAAARRGKWALRLPDLAQIGVRQCHFCGCTSDHACKDGCTWVEANRCSACVTP